ncbi:hypothetical protein P4O66_001248, partial [Electrophorus voltai]
TDEVTGTDDVSEFTEAAVEFIGKMVDDMIPRATIKAFPNQKPWVDKTMRKALNSRINSTIIAKFACDTVVMGLISDNNDERAYLENWCRKIISSSTSARQRSCSKKQEWHYQPVRINGTTVERVDSPGPATPPWQRRLVSVFTASNT